MPDKNNTREDGRSIDGDRFVVLANAEGQHSIWPAAKPAPEGWTEVGPAASKAECVTLIETRWTDMKPQSLRQAMQGGKPGAA